MIKQKPVFTGTNGSGPIWLAEDLSDPLFKGSLLDDGAMIDNSGNLTVYWNTILQALNICFEVGDNHYEKYHWPIQAVEQPCVSGSSKKRRSWVLIDDFLSSGVSGLFFSYRSNDIEDVLRQKRWKRTRLGGSLSKRLCEYDFWFKYRHHNVSSTLQRQSSKIDVSHRLCSAQKDYKRAKQMLFAEPPSPSGGLCRRTTPLPSSASQDPKT